MAEASPTPLDSLSCPVCLDLLKNPVAIPCGHSFCLDCIKDHWDQGDWLGVYSCPLCRHTFTPRPVLNKNTVLAELAENLRRTRLQTSPPAGSGDVECDVCAETKLRAVRSCLTCLASYCEDHIQPHYKSQVFKKHKLVQASMNLQQKICPHHDKLLEVFCRSDQQCVCLLCVMDEHSGHTTVSAAAERAEKQSFQSLPAPPGSADIPHITTNPQFSTDKLKKAVTAVMERVKPEFIQLSGGTVSLSMIPAALQTPEPKTREDFLKYSCRLTLDPNTAHRQLALSEGNRKATVKHQAQEYPDHPERFDEMPQVLCRESVSGRCYWEANNESVFFEIAVSYKSISRKGENESSFGFNDQSWSLMCSGSNFSFIHNNEETELPVVSSYSRIGVYVDHRAGILAFYSVSDSEMTLLHRVHTTFTQPLYPGFRVYSYGDFFKILT